MAFTDFLRHFGAEYLSVEISDEVLSTASDLTEKHPLRSLDAIHLASAKRAALMLNTPLIFLCSDNNLKQAAIAEGLAVDDPILHP
jgi:predicted nucleic acid-binding protein